MEGEGDVRNPALLPIQLRRAVLFQVFLYLFDQVLFEAANWNIVAPLIAPLHLYTLLLLERSLQHLVVEFVTNLAPNRIVLYRYDLEVEELSIDFVDPCQVNHREAEEETHQGADARASQRPIELGL